MSAARKFEAIIVPATGPIIGHSPPHSLLFWHTHTHTKKNQIDPNCFLSKLLLLTGFIIAWQGHPRFFWKNIHFGVAFPNPNQQRTLNKLPTELQNTKILISTNWEYKSAPNMQKHVRNVYMLRLSFHFAHHRWWLGWILLAPPQKTASFGETNSPRMRNFFSFPWVTPKIHFLWYNKSFYFPPSASLSPVFPKKALSKKKAHPTNHQHLLPLFQLLFVKRTRPDIATAILDPF